MIIADLRQTDAPIVYVNAGAEKITGYRASDLIGRNCRFLQGIDRGQPQIDAMRKAIAANKPCKVTLRNFRRDGTPFWNEIRLLPLFDRLGSPSHYVAFVADVTETRDALIKARSEARFDPQTGLLNRQGGIDELEGVLARKTRGELSVAILQTEGLLEVATTIGEDTGDALLRVAAERLQGLPGIENIARLPFARLLLIVEAEDHKAIRQILRSAIESLEKPYSFLETNFALTATCGYTLLEQRKETAAGLVREASIASNGAREQGPGTVQQFNIATDKVMKSRLRLLSDLRTAMNDDELVLHYQPKVDLTTGAIVGAEALLRWQHGLFGTQPPSRFLPMVEKSNMIVEIGWRSLTIAAKFSALINRGRLEKSLPILPIAVNISPTHFKLENFVAELCSILVDNRAQPEWLSLEMIETVLAEVNPTIIRNFAELRDMGVGIAVDDFGVGYSNLTYLRDFPLTELKIDQTFIRNIQTSPANAKIVRAVASLAREFDLKIVAEGVETQAEHEAIVALGCRLGQGYYYSVPCEGGVLQAMIARDLHLPTARTA